MIGSPAELRERLFARSLVIRTRAPLQDPRTIFADAPAVDDWHENGAGEYVVAVSDPDAAAPPITRALVEADADVLSIAESRHSLEDVYLQLIDQDSELERRPA
jgi:ABC-2 type transport system ATP-binding protein